MTAPEYIGGDDRAAVLEVARAAQTIEVAHVLRVSGDLRSLVVDVRLHVGIGDHRRCYALHDAAQAALAAAPATMACVTAADEHGNRAFARRRP